MTATRMRVFLALMILSTCVYARLEIKSPPELAKIVKERHPNGIPYSVANYGDVPFGKSLVGNIYLPESYMENCIFEPLEQSARRKINKIVLSSRGDCTFTTKSLNAQAQGAKLAIISDNVDTENPGRIILVDDGRGPQVHIPTLFIEHELGQLITQYILDKKTEVSLFVNFETIHSKKVDVTLWIDSYDRASYILVRQLQPYLDRIADQINFSVRHPTTSCKSCPETDCFGDKNAYCKNTGFFGYMVTGYGQEIIRQQLREELILKDYNASTWWKYMEKLDEQCDDKYSLGECSKSTMGLVGINADKIEKLVDATFEKVQVANEDNTTKTILQNQLLAKNNELKYQSGIIIFPGIIVNNITYRGNLQALQVFEMVCNSFSQEPTGCSLDVIKPQTPWRYLLYVALIIIIFVVFLVGCYRRRVRRELSKNMNKEVNELVNQYITMYETQRFEGQGETPSH